MGLEPPGRGCPVALHAQLYPVVQALGKKIPVPDILAPWLKVATWGSCPEGEQNLWLGLKAAPAFLSFRDPLLQPIQQHLSVRQNNLKSTVRLYPRPY